MAGYTSLIGGMMTPFGKNRIAYKRWKFTVDVICPRVRKFFDLGPKDFLESNLFWTHRVKNDIHIYIPVAIKVIEEKMKLVVEGNKEACKFWKIDDLQGTHLTYHQMLEAGIDTDILSPFKRKK